MTNSKPENSSYQLLKLIGARFVYAIIGFFFLGFVGGLGGFEGEESWLLPSSAADGGEYVGGLIFLVFAASLIFQCIKYSFKHSSNKIVDYSIIGMTVLLYIIIR